MMNFVLNQEERIRQLEDYMQAITDEFMEFSSEVTQRLKERIKENENKPKKIKKITRYPDTEDLEPLNDHKFLETLTKEVPSNTPKIVSPKSLCVKHVCTILPSPPLVRESTFGFKPDDVEEIIGIPIEVERLDEIPLEDVGLNTCNHDIPLSSREILNFDVSEPQPQPLPNFPSLDESLGNERGPEPPIEPHILDSFRMKVVDNLTTHTPLSPYVASSYPKDMYCNYHPCLDDPKRHYGFKPGLLEQNGSLDVDFSNVEEIKDDFLGEGFSLAMKPKDLENGKIKETHHLEQIIQQPTFQYKALSYHNGVYRYYHPYLNSSVGEPSPLSVK
ncbi:hypothetical protein Tco_0238684 [Tanacetum coccineum]